MMNSVPAELIGPRKRPRIICKEEIDEKSKKVLQKEFLHSPLFVLKPMVPNMDLVE